MIDYLENAITSEDCAELSKFWSYFRSRRLRLNSDLTEAQKTLLHEELERLSEEGAFLLRRGAIEAYLPAGARSVSGVVSLTADAEWHKNFVDREGLEELFVIASKAIGAPTEIARDILNPEGAQGG
jgi:hypothetical protein